MKSIRVKLEKYITKFWYAEFLFVYILLWPFTIIFFGFAYLRRLFLTSMMATATNSSIVIVVGNITAGGTGKTPLVSFIANNLKNKGYKVAIAIRGYGGSAREPVILNDTADYREYGDEAILYKQEGLDIGVGSNRAKVIKILEEELRPEIIICDDGLQHYRLAREIEIAAVDGHRKFGNGLALPFGPLREPLSRLKEVDFIVSKSVRLAGTYLMRLSPERIYVLGDRRAQLMLKSLDRTKVHAVAGIGNPDQFFNMLRGLGIKIIPHVFPDHHMFTKRDLSFSEKLPIIMTEKDAIKCVGFSIENAYVLSLETQIDEKFLSNLMDRIEVLKNDKQKAVGNISLPNL